MVDGGFQEESEARNKWNRAPDVDAAVDVLRRVGGDVGHRAGAATRGDASGDPRGAAAVPGLRVVGDSARRPASTTGRTSRASSRTARRRWRFSAASSSRMQRRPGAGGEGGREDRSERANRRAPSGSSRRRRREALTCSPNREFRRHGAGRRRAGARRERANRRAPPGSSRRRRREHVKRAASNAREQARGAATHASRFLTVAEHGRTPATGEPPGSDVAAPRGVGTAGGGRRGRVGDRPTRCGRLASRRDWPAWTAGARRALRWRMRGEERRDGCAASGLTMYRCANAGFIAGRGRGSPRRPRRRPSNPWPRDAASSFSRACASDSGSPVTSAPVRSAQVLATAGDGQLNDQRGDRGEDDRGEQPDRVAAFVIVAAAEDHLELGHLREGADGAADGRGDRCRQGCRGS